jgi:hypothetical protein
MDTRLRIAAIVATTGLLLVILELVRRKRLMERYAILWLLAGITLIVLAVWKGLLTTLANKVGIFYPPSALFAVALAVILILLLHFSLVVSRLSDQNKVLAQRLGMLQQRIEEQERGPGSPGEPAKAGTGPAAGDDDQGSRIEELSRTG